MLLINKKKQECKMLKELSNFGKRIRNTQAEKGKVVHNAIAEIPVSIDLLIKPDGSFDSFLILPDDKNTLGEALAAKKGKARLLLDKAEEVLSYVNEVSIENAEKNALRKGKKSETIRADYIKGVKTKYQLFQDKLKSFSDLEILKPVLLFYTDNKKMGVESAANVFSNQVGEKLRNKNIAFRLVGDAERMNEKSEIINAIIAHYDREQQSHVSNKKCSICGMTKFPVVDEPHGMIKKVPRGQSSGTVLVSYNEPAFESYGLIGNENCSICTDCARNYVDGLNDLLNSGYEKTITDKKGKQRKIWKYKNRRDFRSNDTAVIYWTREDSAIDGIDLLEEPDEEEIGKLFDSVAVGKEVHIKNIDTFYSCTLSGAAARIAIRDWVEISLAEYRQNIVKWFKDIEITTFDFIEKNEKLYHPSIGILMETVKSEKSTSDMLESRMFPYLWSAAVKHTKPPFWILQAVLKQTRYIEYFESGGKKTPREPLTKERAALIRLILNRNSQGGIFMDTKLDQNNKEPAYVCGQIFSVLVDIQRAALGKNLNAGIRERFFSFASTAPASAFGRLMPLSQKHLSKLKNGDKAYLYDFFDKKLRDVCADLKNNFPPLLTLEERGQFALGDYHKKLETLNIAKQDKKLQEVLENKEQENEQSTT
jgi:CRISPR-associated protein Csd1